MLLANIKKTTRLLPDVSVTRKTCSAFVSALLLQVSSAGHSPPQHSSRSGLFSCLPACFLQISDKQQTSCTHKPSPVAIRHIDASQTCLIKLDRFIKESSCRFRVYTEARNERKKSKHLPTALSLERCPFFFL